jgi:ATP-dependent exoDNAse (exonuclease V) alpha subunit
MDTLIIDEISMVRADMIDNIDIFLRNNRENDLPFGGVQLLMFGDLFQLPPVVATAFEKEYFRTTYESQYFFSSHVVKSDDFHYEMIELNQVYRQEERYFINMLDAIRLNHIDYDELEVLNERYQAVPEDTKYLLTLTSINATANNINNQEVNKLEGESFTYLAKLSGQFNERNAPADPVLKLKKGAQVMFVKNDPQKQFVNGTIGIINDIGHDYIKVMVEDNSGYEVEIDVGIQDWEIIKYELDREKNNEITANVVGVFSQYPIKLAWAITIHKSQGKTFDKINIDLGRGAFEHGQTYVALSRCKTLGGIFLNQALRPRDILVDERVREYYQMMR